LSDVEKSFWLDDVPAFAEVKALDAPLVRPDAEAPFVILEFDASLHCITSP
jgi:hypothetical protein